ncbi:MAG TPA: hypothetical protein VFD09_10225 [Thiopseudomonas sp.]|nr:hypothetical protein [Thiopseudomonas sp.]
MKNAPTGKTNRSALDALTSMAIVAANNPTVQQTMPVLALALGYVAGVQL